MNEHSDPFKGDDSELVKRVGLYVDLLNHLVQLPGDQPAPDCLARLAQMLILFLAFPPSSFVEGVPLFFRLVRKVVLGGFLTDSRALSVFLAVLLLDVSILEVAGGADVLWRSGSFGRHVY